MLLRDTQSTEWLLWLYQFALVLVPGVAFMAVTIGIYLLYEASDRFLEAKQEQPIAPDWRGIPDIALSQLLAAVFLWGVRTAITIGVAFIGIVLILLIEDMRDPVQQAAKRLEEQHAIPGLNEPQMSTDFILLLSLFGVGVSITSVTVLYTFLRRLARDWRAKTVKATGRSHDPLFVRLFAEFRFAGLIVMFVLFYLVLGIVMQIIWAMVLLVPLPVTLTQHSSSYALSTIVWVFALIWLLMIISIASPILGLLRRWFLLTLSQYRKNRIFQLFVKLVFAAWIGVTGFAIDIVVLSKIGEKLYPAHYSWTAAVPR